MIRPKYEHPTCRYRPKQEAVSDEMQPIARFSRGAGEARNGRMKQVKNNDRSALKGSKCLIIRNWGNFKSDQNNYLGELRHLILDLEVILHHLGGTFQKLGFHTPPLDAMQLIQRMARVTVESEISPAVRFAQTLA